ncbi:MAG: hypothetical protein ACXIVF_15650 [Rhizobiaceae bacterium]
MEILALIAIVGCAGALLAFLLLRRSKHARRKPRCKRDFLDNPNEWGW